MNTAVALGRLGDPRPVEPLLAVPHDEEHRACASIALALGHLKSKNRSSRLFRSLSHRNSDGCENAAIALVLVGDSDAVAPLIKALDSGKDVVRRGAA